MTELTLSQAQLMDPLLNFAAGQNDFAPVESGHSLATLGRVGARLFMAAASVVGVAEATSIVSGVEVAHADYRCSRFDPGAYRVDGLDGNGVATTYYMCPDNPTPTTVKPTPTIDTNPVTTIHTNPQPTPNSTTPPIVYVQVDNDGDAYSLTARQDTGEIVNAGYEIDDNSAGEGDPGLAKLRAEFEARGLSFDADPDKVGLYTLVGLTVSPADFAKYIDLLANTPVTTTTTTTVKVDTTDAAPEVIAPTTTIKTTTTVVNDPETTESEITTPVGDNSGGSGGSSIGNKLVKTGAAVLGALGLGALVISLRRRRVHDEPQTFGGSPVAGH